MACLRNKSHIFAVPNRVAAQAAMPRRRRSWEYLTFNQVSMEIIRVYVEYLINLCGVSGVMVPVLRHVSLIVITILLAWLSDFLGRKLLVPFIRKITSKTETTWDDALFNQTVLYSMCHIFPAIVVWELLPLVFYQYPTVQELLKRLTAIYITVMAVRLSTALIDSFKQMETKEWSSRQQYFQTFCGVMKIGIFFVAAIIVVAILLGKSPMTLFAGLGATSAILMLVFKDTIEGLVAGVRLTSNDMVHKGDWITVASAGADGTVEEISLTTVKVRNFDNTIVTVSPKTLVENSFQNWKGMQEKAGRRMSRVLYFDMSSIQPISDALKTQLQERQLLPAQALEGTPINLTLFRLLTERYLRSRSDVLSGQALMVRQLRVTPRGMPLEVYCFVANKEWVAYEHQVADIMEHIIVMAQDLQLCYIAPVPSNSDDPK